MIEFYFLKEINFFSQHIIMKTLMVEKGTKNARQYI